MQSVTLPWPPRALNPNTRTHWAVLAREKKAYREACGWAVKEAKITAPEGQIEMEVTFYAPDKRPRDLDNLVAAMKAGFDGMADAMGVDDVRFRPVFKIAPAIGGFVKVKL